MIRRILISIHLVIAYVAYSQSEVVILKEVYKYNIENLDNYNSEILIEGLNIGEKTNIISFPFSELSSLEESESFELKKDKWKASKINQTATISTIDYSSFFSGYKYLRYEIPPGARFKLTLRFQNKHAIFLTELNKKGRFNQTSNVRYEFNLPEGLMMTTDRGDELSKFATFDSESFDTSAVISFLIHPKSMKPSDYFSSWFSERTDPILEIENSLLPNSLNNQRENQGDSTFAATCFDFVKKEIRYVDVENGINALIPRQCKKTLENKLGDCKDMATLLTAIYRYYGYEAYLAISQTNSRKRSFDFPSIGLANHMICALKLNNEWYFLDPTENGCLFGDPSLQIFGTKAFLIGHETGYFQSIPSVTRNASYGKITYNINEESETISMRIEAKGKMNLLLHYIKDNYNSPNERIESVLLRLSQNSWEVDSLLITSDSSRVNLSLPIKRNARSIVGGSYLYNPSSFLLSMETMVHIFQNNAFPLFESNLRVKLMVNGTIESTSFKEMSSIDLVDKKSVIFECSLRPNDNLDNVEQDSAYTDWNWLLKNPIIVDYEN